MVCRCLEIPNLTPLTPIHKLSTFEVMEPESKDELPNLDFGIRCISF